MVMQFDNRLKGSIALEIVSTILGDAGCHVTRQGVEEQLPVLKVSSAERRNIPRTLRSTPDILVLPPQGDYVHIEVKFRASWDKKVRSGIFSKKTFKEQVRRWESMWLVIVVGTPPLPQVTRTIFDHIKVIPVGLNSETNEVLYLRAIGERDIASRAADADWVDLIDIVNAPLGINPETALKDHSMVLRIIRAIS